MSSRSYGIRKVMSSIPVGDSDFFSSRDCPMLVSILLCTKLTSFLGTVVHGGWIRPSALFQRRILLSLSQFVVWHGNYVTDCQSAQVCARSYWWHHASHDITYTYKPWLCSQWVKFSVSFIFNKIQISSCLFPPLYLRYCPWVCQLYELQRFYYFLLNLLVRFTCEVLVSVQ